MAQLELAVPLRGGSLQVTVFGPSDDGATPSMKGVPWATVVISPGFMLDRSQSDLSGAQFADDAMGGAVSEIKK